MFESDLQVARAMDALLCRAGLHGLWDPKTGRPTGRAHTLRELDGGPLSSGERALFLFTLAVWNGDGWSRSAELLRLDSGNLKAVGSLLVAIADGPQAIEAWIESARA